MSSAVLPQLLKGFAHPYRKELIEFGIEVNKLYTDHGLPLDITLNRLEHPQDQKLIILEGACEWLVQHKRNSGATEKAIERQRVANRNMLEAFAKGKELGVY